LINAEVVDNDTSFLYYSSMHKLRWTVGGTTFEISGDEDSITKVMEAFGKLNCVRQVLEFSDMPEPFQLKQIGPFVREGVPRRVTKVLPNGNSNTSGW
jgi:uncharacterized protein YciI